MIILAYEIATIIIFHTLLDIFHTIGVQTLGCMIFFVEICRAKETSIPSTEIIQIQYNE